MINDIILDEFETESSLRSGSIIKKNSKSMFTKIPKYTFLKKLEYLIKI